MHCPNGDKNFNKILEKMLGHPPTPNERNNIYYFVCILLRLSIASFLLICKDRPWIPYIFLIGSALSIINYYSSGLEGDQWWSKRFQLIMAILIFSTAVLQASCNCVNTFILPILFFISITGGIIQSFIVKRC